MYVFSPEPSHFPLNIALLGYQVPRYIRNVDELLNACWWRINYRRYRTGPTDILYQTRNYTMTVLHIQVF